MRGREEGSLRAGPGLLVRVGVLLILITAAAGTAADADLWGHLRFGQDILRTHRIVQIDDYSFTSDRPWINHEWLSEVTFAWAYGLAGSLGLLLVKLSAIAALLLVVWRHVVRVAPGSRATLWMLVFAFAGTYWRTHSIRPQIFSVLLFAGLLALLTRADDGRRRGLVMVPAIFALWVNFHGGWIVGLGVLGFWTAVRSVDRRLGWGARVFIAGIGIASVAATLVNPYGRDLWRFMAETVGFARTDIEDWSSVVAFPLRLGLPWALCGVAAILVLARGGRPRHLDYAVIVAGSAIASFRVGRLDAFYALALVMLLTPQIARTWDALVPVSSAPPARPAILAITVMALAIMLVPVVRIVRPYAGCIAIGGAWAPDADAGRFIALNHLEGRMLTWFDWGQYAIWHFGPRLQVSMDGRRETVYTERTIQAHRRLYAADASADTYLRALNPDYIWIPAKLPIAVLLPSRGWVPIFTSPVSRIFARPSRGPFQAVTTTAPSPRCFPGP